MINIKLKTFQCNVVTFLRRKYLYYTNHWKKNRKYNISHITYYACSNVGDTALSDTVRRGFELFFKDIKWELCDVSEPVNEKKINIFNSSDAIVIGGGGLFLPDTNQNSISGWQWPCSLEDLDKINKPIILFSVGYNYFRGQKASELFVSSLNAIIEKSSFIGLRNYGSIHEIKKLIRPELRKKISYQPCLTTLIRKLYPNIPEKKCTNKIALNVAFDRIDQRLGNNKEKKLEEIAEAISIISKKGYEIYYIAHIVKDVEFIKYLNAKKIRYHLVIASSWSAKKIMLFYNNMDLVIGMRGHAQMIPFGLNCHIITLGTHNKMKWFLEDIDALDWYIELSDNINLSREIIDKFKKIHECDSKYTTKRLINAQNNLYKVTLSNFKIISHLIC